MTDDKKPGLSRRRLLTAASATVGVAAGSGAITGFPTIWAQNIKDVELKHAGQPVTAIQAIGDQATKDLGFKVTMQASESADLLNRFLTQSAQLHIADVSLPYFKYMIGRNILQTIPMAKFKNWDATYSLFTKSKYPDGRDASKQGIAPYTVLYATDASFTKFSPTPTEFLTSVPTITNADTLGIRPDLVGRPDQLLGRSDRPGVQGQVRVAGQPDRWRHRCRHGARITRRHQIRQQRQHDER